MKLTKKQEAELRARIIGVCPEVIGHPIRLEHILRLIDNFEVQKRESGEIFHRVLVDSEGWIMRNAPIINCYIRLAKFDLTKPFDSQTNYFKTWLYNFK